MANNAVKSYRKLAPKSSIKGRPTLGFGASSSSTGVGLFAQTPHCLRKNGVSWATQKSRTARIQSGSQGRAGWPGLAGCGKSRSVVLPAQFVAFCPFVTR